MPKVQKTQDIKITYMTTDEALKTIMDAGYRFDFEKSQEGQIVGSIGPNDRGYSTFSTGGATINWVATQLACEVKTFI